ncbi:hypothetical protein A3H09_00805 [Candidatus Falkowbacteria bacterium RIFCSPLOWO2_12_FULL_45_13]|uniref:HAD family hydrolase n=1 Tax=Candidatus Falkowbacteria bacterium RIFCSPLOWO2_12_FULL_45_13 TaxID=1797991 RepID=A0A1F5SVT2_9BACT|nr:MAG: hypothetical protein A3H09_00805 [Candidatus Falkowbacteria bacterium RIFCSPLOWO2_12_FULL_45_13]
MKKTLKKLPESIKLVLFDLDDTLYDEADFVKSGLGAVAEYLAVSHGLDQSAAYKAMIKHFKKQGRGKIFNQTLSEFKINPTAVLIKKLVSLYRRHRPEIKVYQGVRPLLERLKSSGLKLALVTDTNWRVQARKLNALGIAKYFDRIIFTDKLNLKKPDLKIYRQIFKKFMVRPLEVLCVGDDPTCDFIGARTAGCQTIRIRQGRLMDLRLGPAREADYAVKSIKELSDFLRREKILCE